MTEIGIGQEVVKDTLHHAIVGPLPRLEGGELPFQQIQERGHLGVLPAQQIYDSRHSGITLGSVSPICSSIPYRSPFCRRRSARSPPKLLGNSG